MVVKSLMGSLTRDLFKWWHKQIPNASSWYASDADLFLLGKNKILCLLDYKYKNDSVTFCEKILYRILYSLGIPIYIIRSSIRLYSNTMRFDTKKLRNQLHNLGVQTSDIEAIMKTSIENTPKKDIVKTMAKDLSVWDYIPDNSIKGYSSKCINDNYIEWEAGIRKQ